MRLTTLVTALAVAATAVPAMADGFSQPRGWGAVSGPNRGNQHYTLGAVAEQAEDANKGQLSGAIGYYLNNSYGSYIHVQNEGDGTVEIDSTNTGDTTAGQLNGDGDLGIGN